MVDTLSSGERRAINSERTWGMNLFPKKIPYEKWGAVWSYESSFPTISQEWWFWMILWFIQKSRNSGCLGLVYMRVHRWLRLSCWFLWIPHCSAIQGMQDVNILCQNTWKKPNKHDRWFDSLFLVKAAFFYLPTPFRTMIDVFFQYVSIHQLAALQAFHHLFFSWAGWSSCWAQLAGAYQSFCSWDWCNRWWARWLACPWD